MSLNATYDADNIFAKIIRGEAPSTKIYEDDDILAFMDVFPETNGHTLVIHKRATAINLLDIDQSALQILTGAVQRIAAAVNTALNPAGLRIMQFNGAPAGQTVFHLHFHIIPVFEGSKPGRHHSGGPVSADLLEPVAAKIRASL